MVAEEENNLGKLTPTTPSKTFVLSSSYLANPSEWKDKGAQLLKSFALPSNLKGPLR
jgi:hypothetical protein